VQARRAAAYRSRPIALVSAVALLFSFALLAPSVALAASTLSGALRNADTNVAITVADVPMQLEKQQPGGGYASVDNQVAVAGAYTFSGLDAGQYRLVQAGTSPFSYFPPAQNPGVPFSVDGISDLTVDWSLVRTGFGQGDSVFSGQVVDQASGSPIVGPTIWVSLDQKSPTGVWTHIIDSFDDTGGYSFGVLGPGEYRVRFRGAPPAGYQRRVPGISPPALLDGTSAATHDWELWRAITTVPATSAWSLAFAATAAFAVLTVMVRRRPS